LQAHLKNRQHLIRRALPKQKKHKDDLLPYRLDSQAAPKLFYTSLTVCSQYLDCLLLRDVLVAKGITAVPHGQQKSVYQGLFEGRNFRHIVRRPPLGGDDEAVPIADASDMVVEALAERPVDPVEDTSSTK
jgi:hypothetical protein